MTTTGTTDSDRAFLRAMPAEVRADWESLGVPTPVPARFDPDLAADLPEPVRRWLRRAVGPGTALRSAVELRMRGEIRLGSWRPFTAVQRMTAEGLVWTARLRVAGLPLAGFDRYTRGSGEMRWRLLRLVPLVSASDADVTRSAAGRLAAEQLVVIPATALRADVAWRPGTDDSATALVPAGGWVHEVTVRVGPSGALTGIEMDRYGDPGGGFGVHRFGAVLEGALRTGGFEIPRRVVAGWYPGTDRWADGAFIRYTVDAATFR
jgi:hypothetical protein